MLQYTIMLYGSTKIIGINRFEASADTTKDSYLPNKTCVFISHKKEDTKAAIEVAEFLRTEGIDVYIDEHDAPLKVAVSTQDHQKIVEYIERGIELSTHCLVIISKQSKTSWWIPFEIGEARKSNCHMAYIVLEEVDSLPSYLKITQRIESVSCLAIWARKNNGFNYLHSKYNFIKLPISAKEIQFTES